MAKSLDIGHQDHGRFWDLAENQDIWLPKMDDTQGMFSRKQALDVIERARSADKHAVGRERWEVERLRAVVRRYSVWEAYPTVWRADRVV